MNLHKRTFATRILPSAAILAVLLTVTGCAAGTPDAGTGGTGGASAEKLAEAKAAFEAGQTPVEWTGPTESVPAPASGSLWVISCDQSLEGCKREAQGAVDAGDALGWETHNINITDPSKFGQAVSEAVAANASAIILPSVDQSFITTALAEAKAAGIPVVSLMQGNVPGPTGVDADVTPTGKEMGELLAAAAIVQFEGKHIDLLPYIDNEYAYSAEMVEEMAKAVSGYCPDCTIEPAVNFVSTQVGAELPAMIVAALQQNTNINVVALPFDPAAQFAVPAIVNAGMSDRVKIYSQVGNKVNIGLIKDGTVQSATIGNPSEWAGWAAVDQALRLIAGQPTVEQNLPIRVITADNIPEGGIFTGEEADFEGHFKELWGLK